jgi:hypothetical protein
VVGSNDVPLIGHFNGILALVLHERNLMDCSNGKGDPRGLDIDEQERVLLRRDHEHYC